MTNVLLSLPSGLHDWAKEQAANNNFADVGDFVQSVLLKEQQKQEGLAEFDRLIQEGEDSGISERSVEEILADARQQARARFNAGL
jgi:antitoxin ParD1/3/4